MKGPVFKKDTNKITIIDRNLQKTVYGLKKQERSGAGYLQ